MRLGGDRFVGSSLMQVLCQMCNVHIPTRAVLICRGRTHKDTAARAMRARQACGQGISVARPTPREECLGDLSSPLATKMPSTAAFASPLCRRRTPQLCCGARADAVRPRPSCAAGRLHDAAEFAAEWCRSRGAGLTLARPTPRQNANERRSPRKNGKDLLVCAGAE